jgi:hypothetical protein
MDLPTLMRALAALAITVGLMVGLAVLLRRFNLLQALPMGSAPGAARRLSVQEQLWLEPGRTRILIVRCDGAEHLVLLGTHGASRIGDAGGPPPAAGAAP